MDKEIHDQPQAVADTLLGRTDAHGRLVLDELRIDESVLRSVDKIVVVACGTAAYAGHVAKYAIEHWCRIPVEVELAHEFRYRDPVVNERTLVVAVSQSGETMDTLMAVRHAREQGAKVLAHREHPRLDHPARVRRRALHARRPGDRGRVHQGVPRADHRGLPARPVPGAAARQQVRRRGRRRSSPSCARCRTRSSRCSTAPTACARPRARWWTRRRCCSSGRHVGFPVAMEGALKLKELAYIHAEGFAAGELKHGPIALIEEGQPVFVIVPVAARPRLAALEGRLQHPGDPRPRRAHPGDRRGRRRGRAAVRRRGLLRAAVARRCWPRCWPSCRCRSSRASWRPPRVSTSTSRATWRSPSRSSDPYPRDRRRGHRRRRRRALRRRRCTACPALRDRLFTPEEREMPETSLAARFAAKEAIAKALGAPARDELAGRDRAPDRRGAAGGRGRRHRRRRGRRARASTGSTCRSRTTPASRRRGDRRAATDALSAAPGRPASRTARCPERS